MAIQQYICKAPFLLECGETVKGLEIAYHTYGKMNASGTNVIWVCHALTASADVADWWKGLIGERCLINPDEYFIVCANIIGSCYGSTGPLSSNSASHQPYYSHFPLVTIRDMVAVSYTHLDVYKRQGYYRNRC